MAGGDGGRAVIRPITVLDTTVIIDLLDTTETPAVADRRTMIELTIDWLRKQQARFVIPAPVIAELCYGDLAGSERVRTLMRPLLRNLRIEVLDEDSADVAGAITRVTIRGTRSLQRGQVKFDALIAGMAHHLGAKWLVTSNVGDLRRSLEAVQSNVQVLDPTEPAGPQRVLVGMMRPGQRRAPSDDAE
jgi:predicted nucleic acid-binding protein